MSEHRDHVFLGIVIEVVRFIALVQNISHHLWRWRIDDCGGDDVGHVPMVPVLGYPQLGIGVKLADRSKMDIPTGE